MENCKYPACHSAKERGAEEKAALINRLKRIEGQIRGIISMVERDAYCIDVLTQVSAVSSAVDSFSVSLLESHVKSCVKNDVREGRDDVLDELVAIVGRMIK